MKTSGLMMLFLLLALTLSCQQDETTFTPSGDLDFISGVDVSSFPEIEKNQITFFDQAGIPKDFLQILKVSGVNTIRLRIWVNPATEHSGFDEVKNFATKLRSMGFKIWLTVHYSDTWADPAHQITPAAWQNLDFQSLQKEVSDYTLRIVTEIKPDYIQIGNEINPGFLHPHGHITQQYTKFIALMSSAIDVVRKETPKAKIIIHFAGIDGATWFFNQVAPLDYDMIGISYYPIWHGKSLNTLKSELTALATTHNKEILLAETAYPFTLGWNDWTNNIVGEEDQLILPDFPASTDGQRTFIQSVRNMIEEIPNGKGLCYWGAELIAWKGNQANNASPWENQALFNFQNQALPALGELKK
ncbi:MAG: glycosyl hydrolase 53 family protein [Cyclobacteriaceae bacterium]|jgi:arabinogalactan endo-1,4-beta-galactosidase|nr:glycosyl hydrolase 53 family protein [Cytophagales bacterium]MCZ8328780.1 glycosyl hydrolase 53 family protein [Cyclobacteriaceae bacterium]